MTAQTEGTATQTFEWRGRDLPASRCFTEDRSELSGPGENHEPAAKQQYLHVSRFDSRTAIDDRIDVVISPAEIPADEHFTSPHAQQE